MTIGETPKASQYVLAWVLWIVSSLLGVAILFWAVRDAMNAIAEALTMGALTGTSSEQFQRPYTLNAVDRFGVLAVGLLSVLVVVFVEHYFRTGSEQRQLLRRFVLVTAIEFGVLFIALAIQSVFLATLGLFTVWSVVVPLAALAVTAALSWVWTRMRSSVSAA
jgi:hypothetical protein